MTATKRRKKGRHISVSGKTFARLTAFAQANDVTVTSIIDAACVELPVLALSTETVQRIEAHAAKQGLTPRLVIELAVEKLIRREP